MAENVLGTDVVCQVAVVVEDVEETSEAWAKLLGVEVPDWSMTDPPEMSHVKYKGETTEARAKLAFFDLGQVRLEIIEPVDRPSTWGDFFDEHGQGLHHIAFFVEGMDEVLMELGGHGLSLVQRGDYTGGRYAYVDGTAQLGCVLELLENF
jgi:catechol 2,3-dioxygenase-like lactoylglutathione lyase family enzyme